MTVQNDMPRDLAHRVSHEIGQVLGLPQVIGLSLQTETIEKPDDYHSKESRIGSALDIAGERLQQTLALMSRYV